jgi:hypothetical protein
MLNVAADSIVRADFGDLRLMSGWFGDRAQASNNINLVAITRLWPRSAPAGAKNQNCPSRDKVRN